MKDYVDVSETEQRITDLLIEFDEMGFAPTTLCPDPEQYAIDWRDLVRKEFTRLITENAALRKRLENAVKLPRLEVSPYDNNDTLLYYLENGHIQQECFNNKYPEQLQKRLAELKGEKE